jgi:hypothetical protein
MKIVMPQSRWIEEEKPDKVRDKAVLEKVKKAKEAIAKKTEDKLREDEELRRFLRSRGGARILGAEIVGSLALPPDERPAFTPQALKALQNERNRGVDENCGRRDIDFAGLRRLLEKFVVEREQGLFEGAPDVSLDEMVLTTSFQITLDASAGTYHIFRFFPVLIPPTLNLNPDHTNQLKITFKGVKGRANPRNREALRQKCLTRLQAVVGATQECNTPNSLLLESLIEAVEGSKSGG